MRHARDGTDGSPFSFLTTTCSMKEIQNFTHYPTSRCRHWAWPWQLRPGDVFLGYSPGLEGRGVTGDGWRIKCHKDRLNKSSDDDVLGELLMWHMQAT
jgi:hypothetical protein